MTRNVIAVLIIVLIFFLIYIITLDTTKLLPIKRMGKTKIITSRHLKDIISNNYYFSLWYNIQGFKRVKNSSNSKYSLLKWYLTDQSGTCESALNAPTKISISIDHNLNNLVIQLGKGQQHTVYIYDIPLDDWNNVIVNLNNNIVDVYINGELRKTSIVHNLTSTKNKGSSSLCVGNSDLKGFIGNVKFGNESISTEDAYSIYKDGLGENPVKSMFDRYRLKLSIEEKNNELSSLEI
jgi:hypothetical protein